MLPFFTLFFLIEEGSDRERNRVREKDGGVFNGYKVWFSYSFIKNFAKDRRKQRCAVDCRFFLELSEAAL